MLARDAVRVDAERVERQLEAGDAVAELPVIECARRSEDTPSSRWSFPGRSASDPVPLSPRPLARRRRRGTTCTSGASRPGRPHRSCRCRAGDAAGLAAGSRAGVEAAGEEMAESRRWAGTRRSRRRRPCRGCRRRGPECAHCPPPGLQYPPTPAALLGVPGGTQLSGSMMTSGPASFSPLEASDPASRPAEDLDELHPKRRPEASVTSRSGSRFTGRMLRARRCAGGAEGAMGRQRPPRDARTRSPSYAWTRVLRKECRRAGSLSPADLLLRAPPQDLWARGEQGRRCTSSTASTSAPASALSDSIGSSTALRRLCGLAAHSPPIGHLARELPPGRPPPIDLAEEPYFAKSSQAAQTYEA